MLAAGGMLTGTGTARAATSHTAASSPATLYVATAAHHGKDNGNATCSKSAPCLTVSHAISVASSGDTISLGAGQFSGGLTIPFDITLQGVGAATVIGGSSGADSVISVAPAVSLSIDDLTVNASQVGGGDGISATTGSVTLEHATVMGGANNDDISVLPGGGSADVSVLDSTIADAGTGAGLRVDGSSTGQPTSLSVIDSTLSGNYDGIDTSDVDTVLRDDTIADNYDRGLFALEGQTTLTGSILAGNAVDCNVGIGLIDGGTNLVGSDDTEGATSCTSLAGADGNVVGTQPSPVDPDLGPLASHGGPTQTQALAPGSPAIGAGSAGDCEAVPVNDTDQRGDSRRASTRGTCDIGAYDTAGATGVTRHVSKAGSDTGNTTCAAASPCLTLAHALSVAVSGDAIALGAGVFAGGVTVPANLSLTGKGASTVITGGSVDSSEISLAPDVTADLSHLTVDAGVNSYGLSLTTGRLSLLDATVTDGDLGDISALPGAGTADISVLGSTLTNAGGGEGIAIAPSDSAPSSQLTVANSTITANRTGVEVNQTTSSYQNDTITDNTLAGVLTIQGQTTLANSILAGNGTDCQGGDILDGGYNLIGADDSNGSTACTALAGVDGNIVGTQANPVDPDLGPLASHGGPTQTQELLPGSPAIGADSASNCEAAPVNDTDQRGDSRRASIRGTCDIGAYDTGGLPLLSSVSSASGPAAGGQTITIDGANLAGTSAVTIGGPSATDVQVVSPEMVTAVTPAHAPGDAVITVTTGLGKASLPAKDYTYQKQPAAS
jgi:hypothetical protein